MTDFGMIADNENPATEAADVPAEGTDADSTVSTETVDGPSVDQVKLALRRVKDPELNLNIVDLGLVYDVRVEGSKVEVDMSLTSPACPSGPELIGNAESAVKSIDGVTEGVVNLVWSPFWTPDRIEPRVRAYLGL